MTTNKVKIFLDDIRKTPAGYIRTYTVLETIEMLKKYNGRVEILSLDHDLGACDECTGGRTAEEWLAESNGQSMPHCDHVGTGYKVVLWMEEQMHAAIPSFQLPEKIIVHSANPVGRSNMERGIKQLDLLR